MAKQAGNKTRTKKNNQRPAETEYKPVCNKKPQKQNNHKKLGDKGFTQPTIFCCMTCRTRISRLPSGK
jgi:hypothetical protein